MAKTEANRARRWREAFARQSASDRRVYDLLARHGLPECHRLHFLQMHLEKLAKAFCCHDSPTDDEVQRIQVTHKVIGKTMPTLVKKYWSLAANSRKPRQEELNRIRDLCRELDLLTPAVDKAGIRKDNCEYPWPDLFDTTPVVVAPCEYHFDVASRLTSHDGVVLLKAATVAYQELLSQN